MTENEMSQQPDWEDVYESGEGIDLIPLAKKIWAGRKTIIICLMVGVVIGVLVAINTPNIYTSTTIMAPQTGNNSKTSQLGGLAALAGINIDMSQQGSDLSPILYPMIVSSVPFKLELMNIPVQFQDISKPVSLYDYYTKYQKKTLLGTLQKYTIGLPGLLISMLKEKPKSLLNSVDSKDQPVMLTEEQYQVAKILDKAVTLDVDVKQGFLTLSDEMPEPLVAAQVAQNAQKLLRRYITSFKVQKAQADLDFIQERYNIVKAEAEGYQYRVAVKSDQYKNLTSNVPQVETSRIQTKYSVSNGVFLELAKQLEQAKIQVKRDTPVFTIVEPVSVPMEKAKPSKPLIVFVYLFLSGIVAMAIIFGKTALKNLKKKWKADNELIKDTDK